MEIKQTKKVVLIGSGPSARLIDDYEYVKNGWVIVVVNHGWMATNQWTYMIHSHDYKKKEPIPRLEQYRSDNITAILNKFGGYDKMGFSVTLQTAYWTLGNLKPEVIGFLGCDMNYMPAANGDTCIYGIGEDIQKRNMSDPDRMAAQYGKDDPDYLNNIYVRFREMAFKNNCEVVNFSLDPDSRLPYTKKSPKDFDETETK